MTAEQRLHSLRQDEQQVRLVREFTDSLLQTLTGVEGTPGKALMRELVAPGLARALDLSGAESKRRFLDTLSGNIHKFPLQEQVSLARAHAVEISSEYRNLASFVDDAGLAKDGAAQAGSQRDVAGAPDVEDSGPLGELRRRLAALPQRPSAAAADELLVRLKDEETTHALEAAAVKHRQAFYSDLRLGLVKLPEVAQRELCEHFADLRAEVARLVESMTQEVSRWLEEKRQAERRGGGVSSLLPKLKTLFQATLSETFLTTFKCLGSVGKRGKEAFLLKLALCLRAVADAAPTEPGAEGVVAQAAQLRKHFFHVEGYGELMKDWLQSRLKQFNDEFTNRVASVLASNPQPMLARLRRTFRPGRWLSLSDAQVEDDIFAVILDDSFPRHVLSSESVAGMLRSVSSYAGAACDFQIYNGIARLPPTPGSVRSAPPRDGVEAALMQVLQRLPPFPALRRLRPGAFLFGRLEVEFVPQGSDLVARIQGGYEEMPAEEFFSRHGPEQFPAVAALAVQLSLQAPQGAPCTGIEDMTQPALAMAPASAPPHLPTLPSAGTAPAFAPAMGLSSLPRGPARYEPYSLTGPAPGTMPSSLPPAAYPTLGTMPGAGGQKFGLEDDEI